ncbi:hypothetical protein GCM10009836_31840 [Pseudonocardia ailaonensis]|uniref:DUF1023 domain-containing protein n=1 Tax=Pseudonocardia ailaonensis TaxID=367279 RepID=A0ABN2N3M4_9PSEU
MRTPRRIALLIASALLSSLTVLSAPAPDAPVPPVGLDRSCAADLADSLTRSDVVVLGCEPGVRGRAVVALGDPATAAHVVVLVPGAGIDLHTLNDPDHPLKRPFGWAEDVRDASPDTAVVLWVGYPTPTGVDVDAATGRLARSGVPALVREVTDLHVANPAATMTVVGHSYGTVLVGLAAPALPADDLVFLASPGVRVDDVAGLRTSARVWAARAADDWIRFMPHLRIGDLGHGGDPVSPGFGAHLLPTDGAHGHDGYLVPGSATLAALAGVITAGGSTTPRAA